LFFTERAALLGPGPLVLSGAEGRHAAVVRRLRLGEQVAVGDGEGLLASCVVTRVNGGSLELAVESRREVPRPSPRITVIQAIPKGDRGELAVEEMTEVGVDVIVPWAAERCVPVWRDGREGKGSARWRVKAREAAKQAERPWLPEVTDPVTTARAAGLLAGAELAVVLEPGAGTPLASIAPPAEGGIYLVIGPEGGISPVELDAFTAAGALTARLGPSVLRASTAGAVAGAVLLSRTSRWA
jgi:16S rRNA (uracil1498-N3)-methyltransferase